MVDDPALDTLASFLKSLADHMAIPNRQEVEKQRGEALAWMRHLTIGAEHPHDPQPQGRRDFGGARRFAAQALAKNHAAQVSTTSQLRDTTWAFVSTLHKALSDDRVHDQRLRGKLGELSRALESDSLEKLRQATQTICRDLFSALDEQKQRLADQGSMLAEHIPDLVGVIENDPAMTVDEATGLFDGVSLRKAAERLAPLSALTGEPVSIIVLSVIAGGEELPPELQDELMQFCAPVISRTFLRRVDIVGRDGLCRFGVLAADCDIETARKMGSRAIVSAQFTANSRPSYFPEVRIAFGVAALTVPVGQSFSAAEDLAR